MASETIQDEGNEVEEIVRVLENGENKSSILEKVLKEVGNATTANQMVIGMSLGWLSGFLALKIGRTAMLAVGGGMILLQIAGENELIKINWDRVDENFDQIKYRMKRDKHLTWINKTANLVEKYTSFSSGFLGGFLISLAAH